MVGSTVTQSGSKKSDVNGVASAVSQDTASVSISMNVSVKVKESSARDVQ